MEANPPLLKSAYPKIALILVEALFFGEKKAAKRWDISPRTIRNYRLLLDNNDELAVIFHEKRKECESYWAEHIPVAIIAGIEFITQAAQEADHRDPDTINAIVSAVKMLAEVGLTKEIIDARLDRQYRTDGEEGQSLAALTSGEES